MIWSLLAWTLLTLGAAFLWYAFREQTRHYQRIGREMDFWHRLHREAQARLSAAARRQDVRALNIAIRECNLYHRRFCAVAGVPTTVILPEVKE